MKKPEVSLDGIEKLNDLVMEHGYGNVIGALQSMLAAEAYTSKDKKDRRKRFDLLADAMWPLAALACEADEMDR